VRMAIVILSLAAIAEGLVTIRRMEDSARHDTLQLLRLRSTELLRQCCSHDIDLGYLNSPAEVRRRADEMSLQMIGRNNAQYCLGAEARAEQRGEP